MDDKERKVVLAIAAKFISPSVLMALTDDQKNRMVPLVLAVISEAGCVLVKDDAMMREWEAGRDTGRKDQRARDAAIVRGKMLRDDFERGKLRNSVLEDAAKAIESDTDAE